MKQFREKHILSLVFWVILVLVAIFTLPNVSQIVRDNGAVTLPDSVQSEVASTIEKKMANKGNVRTLIAVFNNKDGKITDTQNDEITDKIKALKKDNNIKITSITGPSDNAETRKQLVSKDKTTQMAMITLKSSQNVKSQTNKILDTIETSGLRTYVTGNDILNDDFSTITEKGVQKTEIIAIIFIFIVLIIVFRSPIVPLISLSTVGVSFIIALNIVMNLAEKANFPVSNFTQVFMVVVMFGIGTDYNILLYDRFKEEMANGLDKVQAARTARKRAGRTILYSGSSVLIGFTVLGLAKFSFYQSAVGVAVGVLVTLCVELTLNVFFMANLGANMFWPTTKLSGTSENRLWKFLSKITLNHTYVMVGILVIAAVPMLISQAKGSTLNYNNADELPSTVQSKKGYEVIQAHFPAGMSGPSTLYIESDKPLNTQENLATIDDLTNYLKAETGVKTVASATQPGGTEVKQLYLKSQLSTLISGLNEASSGLKQVQSGLNSANSQLTSADLSSSLSQVQQLADGTSALQTGAQSLSSGISTYTAGVGQLASGTSQLSSGASTLSSGVGQLSSSSQQLTAGLQQLQAQASQLSGLAAQLSASSAQGGAALTGLSSGISQLATGSSALSSGLSSLQAQVPTLTSGVSQLNSGAQQLTQSSSTLVSGGTQVASASAQVNTGVQTLNTRVQQLSSQVSALQDGLTSATTALGQIDSGTGEIKAYLQGMQKSYMADTFYIPKDSIKSSSFKPALDAYMSKNHKITSITIVLKGDPSTTKSANQITQITSDVKAKLKHSSLKDATVAIGGQTSQTADLERLANSDFMRTVIIMLIGIGIALLFVTRSVIQAMTIIGTLVITYVSAIDISKWLSATILGRDLLTWNTPFFSFIMLIALGVDYSIFLMMRYRDDAGDIPDVRERIHHSATIIGAVVVSAAVILGGTFAALIPSGVITLIQVAMVVIIGLIILVITLPIIMPAMVKWTYPYVNDKMYQKVKQTKAGDVKKTDTADKK
ncbi:MMPL family transporter [Agrilactobacillus yilanensis]|uniref:MMPL family transporter n=1 Tax=Agrilactobacillus yilanensis TaxID=2485997 RepID=A0ABW4J4R1_9LACO|nr:MMPL family transporter [Agrilactobacillus yilanensis]